MRVKWDNYKKQSVELNRSIYIYSGGVYFNFVVVYTVCGSLVMKDKMKV